MKGCGDMKNNGKIKAWINIFRIVIASLNLIALADGITVIVRPTPYMLWNLYGYLVLLALIGNLTVAYFGGRFFDPLRRFGGSWIIPEEIKS
jgi:hypothetical protein